MALIKTIDTKASNLRANDVILLDGDRVKITGIANRPDGTRRVILDHRETMTLKPDDVVDKVVE